VSSKPGAGQNGVTQFEAALGQEIQLPPGKMEELEKSLRVARKEQSESKD
jgi:hypothetical protein